MSDESPTLRLLQELDESTDWEQPGDVLAINDKEEGNSSVALLPTPDKGPGGPGEGLDSKEDMKSILGCVDDMVRNGAVEDILVIANLTLGDEQIVFTTVQRNDLIIGMLEIAKMNWFSTQLDLQSMEDEDREEV